MDRVTGSSEVGQLSSRALEEQVRVKKLIQKYSHRVPRTIFSDREYDKGVLRDFCVENHIRLTDTRAHSH